MEQDGGSSEEDLVDCHRGYEKSGPTNGEGKLRDNHMFTWKMAIKKVCHLKQTPNMSCPTSAIIVTNNYGHTV